ncbi:putative Proliferating cell nuclear antigen [Paratrimastix pyriformis]|uniref:DNA sliding clamp PCNA n=1 Tax=Paratrimastix pyriformis TaxID=342808 RepID=A0ABQ8UAP4_9EUKA|nr:putative Proliferating cell nuclear antigen [Paratrimastix pyriformis]
MFELRFEAASLLKQIIDAIKELTDQCTIEVSSTGLALQAMDSSHVSLITFKLKAEFFASYRCDRTLNLGLNLKVLNKLLKTVSNTDKATLRAEDDGDQLKLIIESPRRTTTFDVKLIDLEAEVLNINTSEPKATIKMASAEFKQICADLLPLGDTLVMEITKDGISFSVTGSDTSGTVTVRTDAEPAEDEGARTEIQLQEPLTISFALRLLSQFTKATPLSPTVELRVSSDQPLCVSYEIGTDGHGSIQYYLAPKIEDEETVEPTATSAVVDDDDE